MRGCRNRGRVNAVITHSVVGQFAMGTMCWTPWLVPYRRGGVGIPIRESPITAGATDGSWEPCDIVEWINDAQPPPQCRPHKSRPRLAEGRTFKRTHYRIASLVAGFQNPGRGGWLSYGAITAISPWRGPGSHLYAAPFPSRSRSASGSSTWR